MPNYDFKCINCDKRFEISVPFSKKEQVVCPECGGKTQQLFTGFLYAKSGSQSTASPASCSGKSCKSCGGC